MIILAATTTSKLIDTASKVFLPAIKGLVPSEMVMAIAAFIDFCYLVRRSHIDEANLEALDKALIDFHGHRQAFSDYGVCSETISLPHQHALKHYHHHIEEFGAPVGLCTSITENKHISAVKKPYRKSSHNRPLGEMLQINTRLDNIELFKSKRIAEGLYDLPLLPEEVQPIAPELDANWEQYRDDINLKDVEEDDRAQSPSIITLAKTPGKALSDIISEIAHSVWIYY